MRGRSWPAWCRAPGHARDGCGAGAMTTRLRSGTTSEYGRRPDFLVHLLTNECQWATSLRTLDAGWASPTTQWGAGENAEDSSPWPNGVRRLSVAYYAS